MYMYYDGSQPQYTHLRSNILAYAHFNLLAMLSRFDVAPRLGLSGWPPIAYLFGRQGCPGVEAYVAPKACDCGEEMCVPCLIG